MDWIPSDYQEVLLHHPLSYLLGVSGVLVTLLFLARFHLHRKNGLNFPVVGSSNDSNFLLAIKEGVVMYPNSPFIIPSNPQLVIAPKSTLDQFIHFKDDEASSTASFQREFYSWITGALSDDPILTGVVRSDITHQLSSFLDLLQEEASHALNMNFSSGQEWTSVKLYSKISNIVALMSSRVFVGRPLSRNPEWLDINVNYTFELIKARNVLSRWPQWAVSLFGSYCAEVRSLRKLRKRAMELAMPIINAQLRKNRSEKLRSDEGDVEGNFFSWYLGRMHPNQSIKPDVLIKNLLNLSSFAAIHTTSSAVTQVLFDLAAYREYIPILVEEINHVILEDGIVDANDGVMRLQKSSLPRLGKLDSFIKESQRVNPISLVSHRRKTMQDIILSTNHVIPKGTKVGIPAWQIENEASTLYAAGQTKPLNTFDGLRYYNLRRLPGNKNKHLFATTSPDSLSFGHGNHACPGRFFAGSEIKIILIEILRNWDFRLPDDIKMEGGAWRRPQNIFAGFECTPCTETLVEFRKKKSD